MSEVTSEVELYDHEVRKIGAVGAALNAKFANKVRANRQSLDEYERIAKYLFNEAGFLVMIDTSEALLSIGYPKVAIVGRMPGSEEAKYGHDHERHGWEVNESIRKGEDANIRKSFKNMYEES